MHETIDTTLTQIQRLVKANYLLLTLHGTENTSTGDESEQLPSEGNLLPDDALYQVEPGLVEQALTTGQIASYDSDGASAAQFTAKVVPITADGNVLGTLTLAWQAPSPSDFDAIEVGASLLGLVVRRTQQHNMQQYYVQALEYLGGLSIELNTLPDIESVLEYVGHTAGVMLNVERAAVFLVRDNEVEKTYVEGIPPALADVLKQTDLPDQLFLMQQESQGTEHTLIVDLD